MTKKAPGKSHREGISLTKLVKMFPDDEAARRWFEKRMWPSGPHCPHCGTTNVQAGIKHKTMTHRCRECEGKPRFSLKTGNIMEGSKLGYQTWAIAVYLVATNLKGVSSMKLQSRSRYHAEVGVASGPPAAQDVRERQPAVHRPRGGR